MSNAVMIIMASGVAIAAITRAIGVTARRYYQGVAELRRADYAGKALLIRAHRGERPPHTATQAPSKG